MMQSVTDDNPGDPWHGLAVVVRGPSDPDKVIDSLTIQNTSPRGCIVAQIRGLTTPDGCED
jgi:hypothetical protein